MPCLRDLAAKAAGARAGCQTDPPLPMALIDWNPAAARGRFGVLSWWETNGSITLIEQADGIRRVSLAFLRVVKTPLTRGSI